MTFTVEDIPDLTGRVAVVTGGNSGIGEVSCHQLAVKGARVFMASRSGERAAQAIERIGLKDAPAASRIEWLDLDLADLANVKRGAEKLLTLTDRIDILLNNAGVFAAAYGLTKDGLEIQCGTNVVGHYLFTMLLLPTLAKTAQLPEHKSGNSVRIVHVSSAANTTATSRMSFKTLEEFNDTCGREPIGRFQRYAKSKAGNILFSAQLKALLESNGIKGIKTVSLHPGGISTNITQGLRTSYGWVIDVLKRMIGFLLLGIQEGALTQLYACTSPEIDTQNLDGAYLLPIAKVGKVTALVQDHDGKIGGELMAFSAAFVKEKVGVDVEALMQATKEAAQVQA